MLEYPNMPQSIALVISGGKATLHELDTVYSVEDVYLMIDIIKVDAQNRNTANKFFERESKIQGNR
jgi:hypothetical protein